MTTEEERQELRRLAAEATAQAALAADHARITATAAKVTTAAIGELATEVRKLRADLRTHPTKTEVRRGRLIIIAVLVLSGGSAGTLIALEGNRADETLRAAVLNTCEERRELEAVLRGILTASMERRASEARGEHLARTKVAKAGVKALHSPPCSETVSPTGGGSL